MENTTALWHPDIPLAYRNQIVTGDAKILAEAIPDESIDLIFTDPIYQRIDDYAWLAETAARVLKSDGELLTYYGQYYFYKTVIAMGKHINVAWPLTEKKIGGSSWIYAYWLSSEVKPLLWCYKETVTRDKHRIDHQFAKPEGKRRNHKWHKGNAKVARWMHHYSTDGDLIFDPFTGGGTVPAVCKMLGRNYIAFEIDVEVAERARKRVEITQPPLPNCVPEQVAMEFAPR